MYICFFFEKTKQKKNNGDSLISSINTEAALQSDISDICKFNQHIKLSKSGDLENTDLFGL